MHQPESTLREQEVANYLQYLQALRSEMTVAMDCIAGNALAPLQESVARQEALCAELSALERKLNRQGASHHRFWLSSADPVVASNVREAGAALCQTNLEYAALLRHSGRTLSLLSSLCSTHTGRIQEARSARSKFQTWSCEM